MRITIQALVEGADGEAPRTETIGTVERDTAGAPASGLGLFLREAHAMLRQLQAVVLREQASQFLDRAARCRQCNGRLATKDSKVVVYRTAFGKARLDSPQLYSRCSRCGACASPGASFSPLAEALPERTHPQWLWLQSRYAAVMSYRLAQTFLREAYPAGQSLPVSSVKVNLRRVGQRLEAETQAAVDAIIRAPRGVPRKSPPCGLAIELEVDAGYIRAMPEREGVRWIHIAMRFEHLLTAVRGLRHADEVTKLELARRIEGAKWLLWHGRQECCLQRLEALRRDTGWAGFRNPLGKLIRYLRSFADRLIDYGKRYHADRPISTSGAESAVDYVIGQRMKKKGHMRWSREGADALLQVRCAVLNGLDVRHFKRWYPPDWRLVDLVEPTAA